MRGKRGFTLIELLIVIAVVATLLTMIFRLGNIAGPAEKRTATVNKLHKIEFALSGYYAAFGTYPPVKLHGSRNPFVRVNTHGVQNTDGQMNEGIFGWSSIGELAEVNAWKQVKAACEAQPISCEFPLPGGDSAVDAIDQESVRNRITELAEDYKFQEQEVGDMKKITEPTRKIIRAGFDDLVSANFGRLSGKKDEIEWTQLQLFRFGLMSYLLPRYLFMMNGPKECFDIYAQWTGNNSLPSDPLSGGRFPSWQQIREYVSTDLARVSDIPSQAACARWVSCFEGELTSLGTPLTFFGVNCAGGTQGVGGSHQYVQLNESAGISIPFPIYNPGGFESDSTAYQYVLDCVTMHDGFGGDFYYYSPAPFQSYMVWSGGDNLRTFPPWLPRDEFDANALKHIEIWTKDDIVGMSK